MTSKLKALEKNILKYRSFQIILLLHELESLRVFIISSMRSTEFPEGTKQPFKKALEILASKSIITTEEKDDIEYINKIRNTAAHTIHKLVADISDPFRSIFPFDKYDYDVLDRLTVYKSKIEVGIRRNYVMQISLRGVSFEQAHLTYREELARLKKKIDRQYLERYNKNA